MVCTSSPRTPSEELRQRMNRMTRERREMGQLALVRRCVLNSAPQCLSERLKTNAEIRRRVTLGHDHCHTLTLTYNNCAETHLDGGGPTPFVFLLSTIAQAPD